MTSSKPIQIIGGGLAGLSLGIGLRLRQVPVQLWEAGSYPRHRVCGEVLSGRGLGVLEHLGLLEPALAMGGRMASTAAFYGAKSECSRQALCPPALCLSRFKLDHLLAHRFRSLGGELHERQRRPLDEPSEGLVRACGRPVQAVDAGWRWFGLKAHARNVPLQAEVEMHLFPSGYIGLSQLADGVVNVCGLFRRSTQSHQALPGWQQVLRGTPGSILEARLAHAQWEEPSFCSVAGLPLRPHRAAQSDQCRLGDALTMISPVTGNGMSMALEAAKLAVPLLAAYSRGELSWPTAQARVANDCNRQFARRLRWSWLFHRALFHSAWQGALLQAGQCAWVWRILFRLTR